MPGLRIGPSYPLLSWQGNEAISILAASFRTCYLPAMDRKDLIRACRRIYETYHSPSYIHPDPLEIPRSMEDPRDQEFAAFCAAVFALGRVDLILAVLNKIFSRFPRPATEIPGLDFETLSQVLGGLRYRFFSSGHIAGLLYALGQLFREQGSLEAVFLAGAGQVLSQEDAGQLRDAEGHPRDLQLPGRMASRMERGLGHLRAAIIAASPLPLPPVMLPKPEGNAKRFWLFLRWMVRDDQIDLGLWKSLSPAELEYPLDTHLSQVALALEITRRKAQNASTRREITDFFRSFEPGDPVKYDFSLTRIGLGRNLPVPEYVRRVRSFL